MSARYLWLQLYGGAPWGFRLKGGKGTDTPLSISRVNAKGRQQGLKEGDRILSVNGQSTADMTHAEAQRAIRESSNSLELQIERGVTNTNMNGINDQDSQEPTSGCQLNSLDEDANHANSWSTDSTSTGSTTIYISPENSESQSGSDRVWSPSRKRANLHLNCNTQNKADELQKEQSASSPESTKKSEKGKEETSPVWQPFGAPYDGPQFRPIKLEMSSTKTTAVSQSNQPKTNETTESKSDASAPSQQNEADSTSTPDSSDKKTEKDSSSQAVTPTTTSTTFTKTGWTSNLPPSQSPTITLLQKAREGQLPKGAIYIDEKSTDSAPLPKNAILIDQKVTIDGDKVHTDSYYAVPTVTTESTTHTIKAPPKYEGIGPTEHGIPVSLRTAVKEEFASDWYKTMYKSLHRNRYPDDKYQTVHLGGYMSEPEFDRKDKLKSKYATTDYRRKPEKSISYATESPSSPNISKKTGTESSVVKHERQNVYKVEPRSIAEYEPGHSSLAEKEFEKFWSDFWDSMDDLHEHLGSSPRPQQGLARRWPNVLLSDGYESDSTLIRKTGRVPHVDPEQQKAWYKEIQKGGEIPFIGLRKSAPEKPTDTLICKNQPGSHVYGVWPPCHNHKHIPNTLRSTTEIYTFRARPVNESSPSHLKGLGMSGTYSAPEPPKRCSSKFRSTLKLRKSSSWDNNVSKKYERPVSDVDCISFTNLINGCPLEKKNESSFPAEHCKNVTAAFQLSSEHLKGIDTNEYRHYSTCLRSFDANQNPNLELCCHLNNLRHYNSHVLNHHYNLSRHQIFNGQNVNEFNLDSEIHPFSSSYSSSAQNIPKEVEKNYVECCKSNYHSPDHSKSGQRSHTFNSFQFQNKISVLEKERETSSHKLTSMKHSASNIRSIKPSPVNGNTAIVNSHRKENFSQSIEISDHPNPLNSVADLDCKFTRNAQYGVSYNRRYPTATTFCSYADLELNSLRELNYANCLPSELIVKNSSHDTDFSFHKSSNNFVRKEKNILSEISPSEIHINFATLNDDQFKSITASNSNFQTANAEKELVKDKLTISDSKYMGTSETNSLADEPRKISYSNYDVFKPSECIPKEVSLCRMITVLPPVIHVSKNLSSNLEMQLVHSVCQEVRKQYCKMDINPLKIYLKKYGNYIPHTENNSIANPTRFSRIAACENKKHKSALIGQNPNIETFFDEFKSGKAGENLNTLVTSIQMRNSTKDINQNVLGNSSKNIRNIESGRISRSVEFSKGFKNADESKCNCYAVLPKPYINHHTLQNSLKNRQNFFTNGINVSLYHRYISSMLQSATRSPKFIRLKNFYSSLQSTPDSNRSNLQNVDINSVSISWKSCNDRWEKKFDRSLRIRHSSVEDLRQIFQNSDGKKERSGCIKAFHASFQYKKLWYNVSVSSLVEKFNKMEYLRVQQHVEVHWKRPNAINYSKSNQTQELDQLFQQEQQRMLDGSSNTPLPSYSFYHLNLITNTGESASNDQIFNSKCGYNNKTSLSNYSTLSNSTTDLRPVHDVRRKVKFFEDICKPRNSLESSKSLADKQITHARKTNLNRNYSWCDLRTVDDNLSSSVCSKLFSPRYLPERAMSCLDLSSTLIDSHSVDIPSNYCDRTPSSVSFQSNEAASVTSEIESTHHIQNSSVMLIKNKLKESFNPFSVSNRNPHLRKNVVYRSSSVPKDLSHMEMGKSSRTREFSAFTSTFSPTASGIISGSVQNLKQKFETELTKNSLPKHNLRFINSNRSSSVFGHNFHGCSIEPKHYRSDVDLRMIVDAFKISQRSESTTDINTSNDQIHAEFKNVVSSKFSMYPSVKRRIQSLIARFENREAIRKVITKPKLPYENCVNSPISYKSECHRTNYFFNTKSRNKSALMSGPKHSVWNNIETYFPQNIFNFLDSNKYSRHTYTDLSGNSRYKQVISYGLLPTASSVETSRLPKVQNCSPRPFVRSYNSNTDLLEQHRKASPHQYQETEVNIHYRSPIRHLEKEYIEEEELRRRQEDAMRKLYEEERRKKQQQELAEIEMRRHSDFFTPSQKSPIPLNRYDNPFELDNRLTITRSYRGPPPKTMARALYPFVAQTPRELSLNKGDILYINKQIDKNWYEGEHHGLVGIFPVTYVEIIPSEKANLQPRKATEGEAIVKYNFRAQTPMELSLFKGEKVVLTRRVDQNWYEGRLGTKKGIFPISYVEVLQEPGEYSLGSRSISPRPPASPVCSPIVNGSPPKHEGPTFNTGLRPLQNKPPLNLEKLENKSSLTQSLHIDTYNEPIPYRSLYSYKPQNDDELELKEGDTVYVMEKCDDGWYVGTSLRTGLFGTFPGNYVERI